MAVYDLDNEQLTVRIDSHGAELKSLVKKASGREYMWCGDAAYWGRTSPVLFPFVGGLRNREYRTKGKTYPMCQHGFARDMEFTLLSREDNEIWFVLHANEETYGKYPYEFVLKLGYRLEGTSLKVLWRVENPGKEELPFSIGGHPAFNCPIEPDRKQSDYSIKFDGVEEIVSSRLGEKGLVNGCMDVYGLKNGSLPLTENLFDHDALILEDYQTDTVSLCDKNGEAYLTVKMDAPLFGVWSPPGKQAPFVCIEPWYGRCDGEFFEGTLEEREWGNLLAPGEYWEASYQILI